LPYASYLGDDYADVAVRWGKQAMSTADEGPSRDKAPGTAIKKSKLGTVADGWRASDRFVADLLETCLALGDFLREC
jgi:hypothetical protein